MNGSLLARFPWRVYANWCPEGCEEAPHCNRIINGGFTVCLGKIIVRVRRV